MASIERLKLINKNFFYLNSTLEYLNSHNPTPLGEFSENIKGINLEDEIKYISSHLAYGHARLSTLEGDKYEDSKKIMTKIKDVESKCSEVDYTSKVNIWQNSLNEIFNMSNKISTLVLLTKEGKKFLKETAEHRERLKQLNKHLI